MDPIKTYEDFVARFFLTRFCGYYALTPGQKETLYQHLKKSENNTVFGNKQTISLRAPGGATQTYLASMTASGIDSVTLYRNSLNVKRTPPPPTARSSSSSASLRKVWEAS